MYHVINPEVEVSGDKAHVTSDDVGCHIVLPSFYIRPKEKYVLFVLRLDNF